MKPPFSQLSLSHYIRSTEIYCHYRYRLGLVQHHLIIYAIQDLIMSEQAAKIEVNGSNAETAGESDDQNILAAFESMKASYDPNTVTDEDGIDVEDWESFDNEIERLPASRDETSSHFSSSSSEEDSGRSNINYNDNVEANGTQEESNDRSLVVAEPEVDEKVTIDTLQAEYPWLRRAFSHGALLPVAGYAADDKDTGDVFQRDLGFYNTGHFRTGRNKSGPPKAKGLPSLLGEPVKRFRMERDQAREEKEVLRVAADYEYRRKVQLKEQVADMEGQLKEADELIRMLKYEVDVRGEYKSKMEEAIETRRALRTKLEREISMLQKELDAWKNAFEKQTPLANAERERRKMIERGWEESQRYVHSPSNSDPSFCKRKANFKCSTETQTETIDMFNQWTQTESTKNNDESTQTASVDMLDQAMQTEPVTVIDQSTQTIDFGPKPAVAQILDAKTQTDDETVDVTSCILTTEGASNLQQDVEISDLNHGAVQAGPTSLNHDEEDKLLLNTQAALVVLTFAMITFGVNAYRRSISQQLQIPSFLAATLCLVVLIFTSWASSGLAFPEMEQPAVVHGELSSKKLKERNEGLLKLNKALKSQRDGLRYENERLETTVDELAQSLAVVQSEPGFDTNLEPTGKQLEASNSEHSELKALSERLEKENAELQRTVKQLSDERIASYSKTDTGTDAETEGPKLGEKLEQLSQLEAQNGSLSIENWELKVRVTAAEEKGKTLLHEKDGLTTENQRLNDECSRQLKLLNELKTWIDGKEWKDKSTADTKTTSPSTAAPVVFIPANSTDLFRNRGKDALLTPSPLPSVHTPLAPTTTSTTPSPGLLQKKPHWIERERQIRNTEEWKRNRDAILKQMQTGVSSPWRSPTMGEIMVAV